MSTTDRLLAAIEAVHAAGLDASLWPRALDAVTQTVGGVGAAFEVVDKTTFRHREFHYMGLPPAEQLEYVDHYAASNPRLSFGMQQTQAVVWDYQMFDEAKMDRSPFYMDFLARMDCRYFVAGIIADTRDEFAGFTVQRSARHGHVGAPEISVMTRLLPHMRQAFDVGRRLAIADAAPRSLERALDWLSDGVVLVRADGSIAYANAAFHAAVRENDGIRSRPNGIEFAGAETRARFAAALAAVHRLRSGDVDHHAIADFSAPRRSGAPAYLVAVRPLPDNVRRDRCETDAIAIVFIRDPLARNVAAVRVLRETFGLTESESSLAQALQSGVPLGDYARASAISLNTAYTHLRRLREKTGCRRMTELIRKLNDLQVPLRVE